MPAAVAACTPLGASSTTRHSSGSTPSRCAAASKQSGAGFPLSTCAHLLEMFVRFFWNVYGHAAF